ncbi:MAG: hypothetical protein NTU63_03945 [Candidatus Pacearchaeota archaeon]|nr:hypothetical protein [Candidatus Pacearchaeota archaeon]
MAKENQEPDYFKDMRRYEYAKLASDFSKSKETQRFVPGALERFASDVKEVSETESLLLKDLIRKGQGLESILGIYPKKCEEVHQKLTLEQFATYYNEIITGYLDQEKVKALKEAFGRLGSTTVEDIQKKIGEATYKLIGHQEGYQKLTDDELKKVQETAEKYKGLNDVLEYIENVYFEELKPEAIKNANIQGLNKLVDSYLQEGKAA